MSFSESLTDSAIRKLEELSDKYEMITKAKVLFKNRNSTAGEGAFVEIELHLPYSTILADTRSANFKMAVMETIGKLNTLLLEKSLPQTFIM